MNFNSHSISTVNFSLKPYVNMKAGWTKYEIFQDLALIRIFSRFGADDVTSGPHLLRHRHFEINLVHIC